MLTESTLDPATATYDEIVPAGEAWIREIQNGQSFRILDVEGNQAADTLFYNARDYEDRYSAQDTIRAQRNIYFFMNVPVTPQGRLTFEDGVSAPGKYVEMRAEMDVLAVISNCPQLNNPCNAYNPTPIRVLIWDPID